MKKTLKRIMSLMMVLLLSSIMITVFSACVVTIPDIPDGEWKGCYSCTDGTSLGYTCDIKISYGRSNDGKKHYLYAQMESGNQYHTSPKIESYTAEAGKKTVTLKLDGEVKENIKITLSPTDGNVGSAASKVTVSFSSKSIGSFETKNVKIKD